MGEYRDFFIVTLSEKVSGVKLMTSDSASRNVKLIKRRKLSSRRRRERLAQSFMVFLGFNFRFAGRVFPHFRI